MSLISVADNALRQGLGYGASLAIGTQFSVYRLNDASTGNWVQPSNLILENFNARLVFGIPKPLEEQTDTYKMWYSGMVDTRRLVVGDILVETGPRLTDQPDGRMYIFVDVRPLQGPVFARLDFFGSISRPNAASIDAEPELGDGGYAGTTKSTEWTYQLNNGNFFVESTGQPCAIPMGMQQHLRVGPAQPLKGEAFPTGTPRAMFFVYIPLLPGLTLQPGDVLSDAIGNRYQIENIVLHEIGLQGYQLIVHSVFV